MWQDRLMNRFVVSGFPMSLLVPAADADKYSTCDRRNYNILQQGDLQPAVTTVIKPSALHDGGWGLKACRCDNVSSGGVLRRYMVISGRC